jgi:hypothetical protein
MLRLLTAVLALLAADPFTPAAETKATVLLFVSSTCPVSNRYAPDFRKLNDEYAKQGVAFWLIYPDPADTPKDIQAHIAEFKLPGTPVPDTKHVYVKRAGATITPEAAVYNSRGQLTYRGRIDDRYSAVGVERQAPTRHDLQDAIAATLAGTAARESRTQAVGCYIADFVR